MKYARWSSSLAIILLVIVGCQLGLAQVTEGTLTGSVTDPSGAAVADVKVVLTNLATGVVRQAESDKTGIYHVGYLQPGAYSLSAEKDGFEKQIIHGVQIDPGTIARADVRLKIGSVQNVIEVSESPSPINTEEARLSSSLSQQQVEDLPLSRREVYSLVLQQPGVTATLAPVISNTQFNTFNYGFQANGTTPRGNNYVLDGVSNNNEWLGGTPAISPSVEAIQTFQVQTSNFAPEYGRSNGSIVAVTTRSGSNSFHGSVYDHVGNPVFDAKFYFDQPGTGASYLKQNNFGVSLGGPIVRDKTFFFFNFEGIRGIDAQTQVSAGETPEFRQQVLTDRAGSIAAQQLQNYPSGPCIAGTAVDTGSIFMGTSPLADAQAVPFYQFIDGDPDGVPDTCLSSSVDKRPINGNQFSFRLDHNISDKDSFFARFLNDSRTSDSAREQLNGAVARGFRAPFSGKFPSILLSEIHVFNPTVLNEVQFMYSRSDFGIGFKAPASASDNYPYLFFDSGLTPFGGELFVPRQFVFNNFTIRDSIAFTHGRHAFKTGVEIQRVQENSDYHSETFGFYEFQDQFTFANDGPYYTEGEVNPLTGQFADTPRHFRDTDFSVFAQDDWKITNRLTLNLGIRYDLYGVPTETNGILSNITLGSGATLGERVAGGMVGRVKTMFNGQHANFSPRLGLAWDPSGKGDTVVHAGYSMAYLAPYSNLYTNASRFDPPDNAYPSVFFPFYGGDISYGIPAIPSAAFQTGVTATGGIPGTRISVSGVQRDLKTAYSEQWFLGVQRKLFGAYYLTADYTGNVGKQLYVRNDLNRFTGDRTSSAVDAVRFNPEWTQTFFVSNGNDSNYNGFDIQLQRRMANHYSLSLSYTVGKALDYVSDPGLGDYFNVSIANYNGTMDVAKPRLDYGRSDFDVRQRVAINGLWEIPSPHGNKVETTILGGWQLNGIISLQSGRPFSVWCTSVVTCDYNGDGDGYDRPDTPSFGNIKRGLNRSDYVKGIFQASDFPAPVYGTDGNLGRNTFQGPGFAQVDASLFKSISLPHEFNLQFRAEAFNLFNRGNLYLPNDILNNAFFGQSTNAFAARSMQLALKLIF